MHQSLSRNTFFIKEHVGAFKASMNYDIFDPESLEQVLFCREDGLGFFTKLLRFTDYKRMTPFNAIVESLNGEQVLRVERGYTFIKSKVDVFNDKDEQIGYLEQKLLTIGGKFEAYDINGRYLFTVKGKWISWEFQLFNGDVELAHVSKKWAGIGKEFFTTADNYAFEISDSIPDTSSIRTMLFAAVMCIDMVLKE